MVDSHHYIILVWSILFTLSRPLPLKIDSMALFLSLLNVSIKCLNVGNDVEQVIKQIFAHQSDYHMYEKRKFKCAVVYGSLVCVSVCLHTCAQPLAHSPTRV